MNQLNNYCLCLSFLIWEMGIIKIPILCFSVVVGTGRVVYVKCVIFIYLLSIK